MARCGAARLNKAVNQPSSRMLVSILPRTGRKARALRRAREGLIGIKGAVGIIRCNRDRDADRIAMRRVAEALFVSGSLLEPAHANDEQCDCAAAGAERV